MEYGSIFGHGAYLGPDYTADYLHRAALSVERQYGGAGSDRAREQTIADFQANRYDAADGHARLHRGAGARLRELERSLRATTSPTRRRSRGCARTRSTIPTQVHELTAFFSWSAWAAAARRPGHNYSYTNNWPPEELVDNGPTANVVLWSVVSLIALLGGIGLLFAAFGRWNFLGWHGREQATLSFRKPGDVALTPAQRACAWFFLVMAALFLIQTMVGAASQHYRAELGDFFGIDLAELLPFNLARTFHVQLAIFFVSTSFLAAGIFLAPMITGREPRRQHWLAYGLLGALAVVVFGSLIGEFGGVHGWFGEDRLDLRHPGVRVPRPRPLLAGAAGDRALLLGGDHLPGAARPAAARAAAATCPGSSSSRRSRSRPSTPSACSPAQGDSFTVTDFWRFWVVHLWVEDFLELFTTVMVAYVFVLLGVVRERVALTVVFLDILLYSVGGVIGTMHHLYFSGEPAEHMALGAVFSAAEVIPLTFLTVEAWSFLQLGARQEGRSATPFPHRWAVMFLVAVGFWNFLGAGIFGFLVNLPIVSYYEIGTALTANHAHAAMMGVYGMLAVGLALFCLRYLIPDDRWPERARQAELLVAQHRPRLDDLRDPASRSG